MNLVLDVEVTTLSNGSSFNSENRLICVGWFDGTEGGVVRPTEISFLQSLINRADLLIGFNFKFDLHWLDKIGLNVEDKRIYDCQIAEYILSHQRHAFPALNDLSVSLFGEGKLDVIKTEYWDKGIDTDKIPWDILAEYCHKDCVLTYKLYEYQQKVIPPYQKTLISLCMQDLLVLKEMEKNGVRFDRDGAFKKEEEALKEKEEILAKLFQTTKVPDEFNFSSPKQLSALLYGGKLVFFEKSPNGTWKSGPRQGTVKFKKTAKEYVFPRRYTPLKGTEGQEKGVWSTDEATLTKLGKEGIVADILRIRSIDKLVGTYLRKLPAMQDENNWDKRYIYGQYNQTTTGTGRLASIRPNLQNFSKEVNELLITRY